MALIVAMILDALFGEPDSVWRRVPHPVALMGRCVDWLETRLNHGDHQVRNGALALAALCLLWGVVGGLIAVLPLQPAPEIIAAAIILAQRSLVEHVKAVASAIDQSFEAGRAEVAKIVGRDTAEMDEAAIARAAIESAAENFSDGVVAPAFWFAVFGLPGMLIYKAVNTADSMIGYRTPRHEAFGKATAKLDDVLNFIPARLSALLISLSRGGLKPMRAAMRDGPRHRSPNAGWPEAAVADALDIALSGPRRYERRLTDEPFVNPDGWRDLTAEDIRRTVALLWRGWRALLILAAILALITW